MSGVPGGGGFLRRGGLPGRGMAIFKWFYFLCALLYIGLVVYWGRFDMGRIHREYRQVSARLAGDYALQTAGREVAAGCRQAIGGVGEAGYGECLRAAEPMVLQRAAAISLQLQDAKRQVVWKLVLFYSLLVLVLIMLPVLAVYVLLVTLLYLCTGIRFDNNQSD